MGRKARSEVLVHEGERYTWSYKGYWRCTRSGDRRNLARAIWERHHGPIGPGRTVIYLDGNRFNVSPENLACLTHSEVQTRIMANPDKRAYFSCLGTCGRLMFAIEANLDPSRYRRRGLAAWETRRRRFGPSGGNAKCLPA
jgi:hypothetical protein